MRLITLKAAVSVASLRGQQLAMEGRQETADLLFEVTLATVHPLLDEETEAQTGWLQAARLLTDGERRLVLDGLGVSRGGQCQTRLAAVLDLPEIASIAALDEVHDAIGATIAIGAPRYNAGDIRGCCIVYWATMQALLAAPVFRGIPQYARALAPIKAMLERQPPPLPLSDAGIDAFAWDLRHAFDATLKLVA